MHTHGLMLLVPGRRQRGAGHGLSWLGAQPRQCRGAPGAGGAYRCHRPQSQGRPSQPFYNVLRACSWYLECCRPCISPGTCRSFRSRQRHRSDRSCLTVCIQILRRSGDACAVSDSLLCVQVEAIHAGLECGIILQKVPGMDAVSYGPTIKGAHSPDERVEIATVAPFWEATLKILGKLAACQ